MTISLLFFGKAREITQVKTLGFTLTNGATVADLRVLLSQEYPALNASIAYAVAINQRYAQNDEVIPANAEVAIIPPVSGG